jgi:hypothetical protein
MPKRTVIAEIETDDEEDNRIAIETTPTPSSSEDEEKPVTMKSIKNAENKKEPNSEEKPQRGRPKKPMSEARAKQLEAMNKARKEKHNDYKEAQAILFLKDRGFNVDNNKQVTKELKKTKEKNKEIHLSSVKAPKEEKPVNMPSVVSTVAPIKQQTAPIKYSPAQVIRKPYNPWAE